MPRCPFCGFEGDIPAFEQLRSAWRYRFYTAYRLRCPKCGGIFNYYEGVSPRGKRVSFTVRVRPRPRKQSA